MGQDLGACMGQDLGACTGQDLGYMRRVRPRCLHGIMLKFLYRAKLDVLARDKAWVLAWGKV